MRHRFSNYVSRVRHVAGLSCALVIATGSVAKAQNDAEGLQGVWMVDVTLRNCTTGAALGPPFHSLVTFQDGGTISEGTASPSFAPGQRSAGHGTWNKQDDGTFLQKMIALIVFDTNPPVPPVFFAGWQTVTHTVQLIDADHIRSAGTNAFYKFDGTL